jgi:hypothetical protein
MNALWFTARGAGLSALLALSVATALGALGSVKSARPASRVVVQYVHRSAAVLGLALIAVHVTAIVLDGKAHVGFAAVFVPFASAYRPGAVALGSIAAYTFALVAALGLARGRLAASHGAVMAWRGLHALSYGAWGVAVLHSINAGTDHAVSWVRLLTLACVVLVVGSLAVRLTTLDGNRPIVEPAPRVRSGVR